MDDLCTACLCTGRTLYFIGETGSYHLYSQILNEIPVYDFSTVCVRVCWECRALLRRFAAFKALVKRSYTELLQQLHQNIPPCKQSLARAPRLQSVAAQAFGWPEHCIKEEADELPHEVPDELELDIKPLKEELEQPFGSDATDDVELQEVKVVKKKKKTPKAKNKKVTKKKKLEEKKINSKKKIKDAPPESLTDSRVLCDDQSSDDVIQPDMAPKKEVKVKQKKKETSRGKKTETGPTEEVVPNDCDNLEESTQKSGPALVGGKPQCAECGKVFSSKKTYRYHLEVLHKGQNRHPCPRCGRVYQWKSNLHRHMRSHQARESGELYCQTCDKRFASVATYRQHLRVSRRHVSESEFSFMCNECGKKFVNKTRLRDHVDWEHLHKVKFRCQHCNKPFKCYTSMYVHTQNIHRKSKKENLCHICGKSYQNAVKLKYHIVAMHTSETPYRCAHCAARFGWHSSLYRHVREVHYKMKLQPKKIRKGKRLSPPPAPLPPV